MLEADGRASCMQSRRCRYPDLEQLNNILADMNFWYGVYHTPRFLYLFEANCIRHSSVKTGPKCGLHVEQN